MAPFRLQTVLSVVENAERGLDVGKTKKGKGTKLMLLVDGQGMPISAFTTSTQNAVIRFCYFPSLILNNGTHIMTRLILIMFICASQDSNAEDFAQVLSLPQGRDVTTTSIKNVDRHIVHILNWHYISSELFIADLAQPESEQLSVNEINKRYREFLLEVEAVQIEQLEVLRHIIRKHDLKDVYLEGLTAENLEGFQRTVERLKTLKTIETDSPIGQLLNEEVQQRTLEIGAVSQLLISG